MFNSKQKNHSSTHSQFKNLAENSISMQILDIIEQDNAVSQRKITMQTGLAAGLVHAYMRKVIAKGWVKAKQVSAKRWLYYLTPEGFMEKSRLTIEYLSSTLQSYRDIQNLVHSKLQFCVENNHSRLIIAGDNDLSEIAALNIQLVRELCLTAVVAQSVNGHAVAGMGVEPFDSIIQKEFDRILVCDASFINWWVNQGHGAQDQKLIHVAGFMPNAISAGAPENGKNG